MDVGPGELLIILVVVLVLFGGKKIPEIARGLGEAQREFRRAASHDDEAPAASVPPTPASTAPASAEPAGVAGAEASPANADPASP